MKALHSFVISAVLATLTSAATAQTIRIAGNFATEHSSSEAMQVFKEELEANSDFEVNIFPAQQLGGAAENVQAVKLGAVEMMWVGTAYLTRTVPELEAISLPFQFADRATAFAVVDGPVGDALDEMMASEDMKSLGYMELGFRQLTNNVRPIETVADIAGLRIRLQPNETHLATFRALGANPVAMDVKELYSALEQGVIDGQENPFSIIVVARYAEVQKYLSNTNHFFDFISVVANNDWFNGLEQAQQDVITSAMDKAITFQRDLAATRDDEALAKLEEEGMTYTPVSDAFAEELRETTKDVAVTVADSVGPELTRLVADETAKAAN